MTSEFLTLLVTIVALAIARLVSDLLDATRGWTLITVLSTGYMLSRGIAKSGTRDPNPQGRKGAMNRMERAPRIDPHAWMT